MWSCKRCTLENGGSSCAACGARPTKKLRGDWSFLRPPPAARRVSLTLERLLNGVRAAWGAPRDGAWETREVEIRTRPGGAKAKYTVELHVEHCTAWQPPRPSYSPAALGMLQSHLQKCTRRGLADLAVRTALEMLAIPHGDRMLRRRLPIILVEDLTPRTEWLSPLVFYLLAGDAFRLAPPDVAAILGIVATAAKEPTPASTGDYLDTPPDNLSLLARAAYGGTKGDVDACFRAAKIHATQSDRPVPALDPNTVRRLRPADWCRAGVDFHSRDAEILKLMRRRDPDLLGPLADHRLTTWMWHARSKVNFRGDKSAAQDDDDEQEEEAEWASRAHALADAAAGDMIRAVSLSS